MKKGDCLDRTLRFILAGILAGAVNGLFGAGGGMVLVPLLTGLCKVHDEDVFPCSVAIILPICVVSLSISPGFSSLPLKEALPYLLAGLISSIAVVRYEKKIPVKWLHRGLGVLIIYGGVRYLC